MGRKPSAKTKIEKALSKISENSERPKLSLDLIHEFRKDPVLAASYLLVRDGRPLTLFPYQQKIIRAWWESDFGICTACRGAGKTFIAAVFAALKCVLYPGIKVVVIGPSFRQSKLIFKEFTTIYNESPLLQSEVHKPPVEGTDQCQCIFVSKKGQKPSMLLAFPLGSGNKIRGQRANILLLDECAQIPQNIFSSVIRPMLATSSDPVAAVQREKDKQKSIEEANEGSVGEIINNGYYAITSGYYKFNYWWEQIKTYANKIQESRVANEKCRYSLGFIPYYHLPKGFLQEHLVEEARATDPDHVFRTEWGAEWLEDSGGAFKMSLLKECQSLACVPYKYGDPKKQYIAGIDPARNNDSSAVVIVEVGMPCKLIHMVEFIDTPWPQQTEEMLKLFSHFNLKGIYMDKYGGGTTLADGFAHEDTCKRLGVKPILPSDTPVGKAPDARKILHLNIPNPESNAANNEYAMKLLEEKWIIMPPTGGDIEIEKKGNTNYLSYEIVGKRKKRSRHKEEVHVKELNLVEELINQMTSIVTSETPSGRLKYDLPRKKGKVAAESKLEVLDDYKKDLYSAFILACKGVYELEFIPRYDTIQYAAGIIREVKLPGHGSIDMHRITAPKSEAHTVLDNSKYLPKNKSYTKTSKNKNTGGTKVTTPWGIVISKSR